MELTLAVAGIDPPEKIKKLSKLEPEPIVFDWLIYDEIKQRFISKTKLSWGLAKGQKKISSGKLKGQERFQRSCDLTQLNSKWVETEAKSC